MRGPCRRVRVRGCLGAARRLAACSYCGVWRSADRSTSCHAIAAMQKRCAGELARPLRRARRHRDRFVCPVSASVSTLAFFYWCACRGPPTSPSTVTITSSALRRRNSTLCTCTYAINAALTRRRPREERRPRRIIIIIRLVPVIFSHLLHVRHFFRDDEFGLILFDDRRRRLELVADAAFGDAS